MSVAFTEYTLNEETIDVISSALQDYMHNQNMEPRQTVRLRITIEEMLLNIIAGLGKGITVSAGLGKQFGRHVFRIRFKGAPYDPTTGCDNGWAEEMMRSLDFFPNWSYRNGINTVSLILTDKAKRSATLNIIIAVAAAVLLGLSFRLCPENLRQSLDELFLTPIVNCYFGFMNTFAGLMICFTVCNGIIGVGSVTAFGKIGKKYLLCFVGLSFVICIVSAVLVYPLVLHGASGKNHTVNLQMRQISAIIFDMLPTNPIEPFQTGNSIQIIIIALIVGAGLLAAGERGSHVRNVIDGGAAVLQQIVGFICKFVPLLVFSVMLRLTMLSRGSMLLSAWKPLALILMTELLIVLLLWLYSSWRLKCSPLLLMKKVLPAFTAAFTTASSMSAMTLGMETCEKRLGIEKGIVSLAYPLGMVIYMPAGIGCFMVFSCSFAEIYHVNISLSWMIISVITVTLLIIATPPIQGAELMMFTVLFSSLGIPGEGLALAIAIEIIADHVNTGFNVMLLIFQIAVEANSLGQLKRHTLLSTE